MWAFELLDCGYYVGVSRLLANQCAAVMTFGANGIVYCYDGVATCDDVEGEHNGDDGGDDAGLEGFVHGVSPTYYLLSCNP